MRKIKKNYEKVPNLGTLCTKSKNWRELTRSRFKKSGKCWRCGFEGYTEWHHFNSPVWYEVEELCSMCHRKSKESVKKTKVEELVKGLKKS